MKQFIRFHRLFHHEEDSVYRCFKHLVKKVNSYPVNFTGEQKEEAIDTFELLDFQIERSPRNKITNYTVELKEPFATAFQCDEINQDSSKDYHQLPKPGGEPGPRVGPSCPLVEGR